MLIQLDNGDNVHTDAFHLGYITNNHEKRIFWAYHLLDLIDIMVRLEFSPNWPLGGFHL